MKNILLLLLVAITFASCEGYLDKSPVTEQTEESFYKTYDDMYAAMISVYEPLQRNWGGGILMYVDIASDDAYAGGGSSTDGVEGHRADRGEVTASDGPWSDFWTKYYAGIYRANLFMEKVEGSEMTDAEKTQMIGEVSFLRAYYYLDLVRIYENVPLILGSLTPSEYEQTQAPVDDVYAQIVADLKVAITNLDGASYPDAEKGRVTKYAAESLMARAFLFYTGVYGNDSMAGVTKSDVVNYLDDVINQSGHDLMPDFQDLWPFSDNWTENSVEGVFEIQFSNQGEGYQWWSASYDIGNKMSVFIGPRGTPSDSEYYSSWCFEPVTPDLYSQYEDGDVRRNYTILDGDLEMGAGEYTEGYQNTGYFNKKMAPLKRDVPVAGQEQLNFPYNQISIRFSDVLLMAAELSVGTTEADGYYNRVRARAFGDDYTAVAGVTLDDIYEERRLELALEGHRYWDLLRRGVDKVEAAIAETAGASPFNSGFNNASRGFWPIPDTEISLSNQALVQNAGY